MNVSIQDAYNIGWKVGLVVKNIAKRNILATYEPERRPIAQALIEYDYQYSRLFSGRPAKDAADKAGVSMSVFKDTFAQGNRFASGVAVDYGASLLVCKTKDPENAQAVDPKVLEKVTRDSTEVVGKQQLATGLPLGVRFGSTRVLNQSDARPWHFGDFLHSDGRFRIVLFAGDITTQSQRARVERFCALLEELLRHYTPDSLAINKIVQTLTIHCAPRGSVDIFDFPEILRPFDIDTGWDYNQIFVDAESYHEGHGKAYEFYGVDPGEGCVVILRPDQHVAYIGALEDVGEITKYFSSFMVSKDIQVKHPKSCCEYSS